MANLSGTISCTTTSTNLITAKITWEETSVDIANNKSTVLVKLIYHKGDSEFATYGAGYFTITVNGTDYSNNGYRNWQYAGDYEGVYVTVNIPHNADGSKSISISVKEGRIGGTTGLSATTGSGTATLTNIPRASTISCTNGSFGGAVTATVTRASSSFTHTLKFSIGSSYSETKTGVGTSLSYTVPASWAASIPAGTSTTMTVTCTTYSGSTQIGSATSTTCTISVPSSWAASASISASLGGTKGDSNQVLKGLTTVTLTCSGTATTGSSISSYKWSGGSTATTASITCSTAAVGSTTYTCTVTDRRGKTASKSYTVTVVDPKSTISGATTGTFGSNYALTISRINSSFTHTVVFYINNSYTSGNRTGKTTSDTYTIPTSWGAAIPTTTSTTVHITCTTYNGSTSLGSVSKDITVSIPSSWAPSVSISKSYTDRGSQNQILAGTTTLTVTASGSASSGATISSYTWSGGYVSGTGASKTHKPASAGTYTYTVTITDSRNKTASATVTETFQNPSSTFTCANSVNFGEALTVSIARLKASYTHIVRYYISSSYTHDVNDNGSASTTYTIPANWAACVPTTSSATMTVTCYTYNGSTQIGSTNKNVTVNVPSSWLPAIGSISATGVSTFNSQYLKGESKATIAVSSVTASTGANISKYKYAGNNISTSETASTATSNSRTTSLLTSVGTNTYTVTVTDSRGRSASKTVSIEVKDYAKPTVRLTVGRYDDQGNPDNFGEYGKMTLTGSFTNVTGNTWTLVCKQKPKTSGTYVTVNTWSNQNNAVNRGSDLFLADVDKTYDCYAIITDAVGYSAEVVVAMSTGRAIQDIYKDKGVGFFSTMSSDVISTLGNPDTLVYSNAQKNYLNGDVYIPWYKTSDGLTNGWMRLNDLFVHHYVYEGAGTAGYVKICRIKIGAAYKNTPICMTYIRRGTTDITPTTVYIKFQNANSTDPSLLAFKSDGYSISSYIVKADTGTWDVYVQKAETYDGIDVVDCKTSQQLSIPTQVTITWTHDFVTSLPSGYVEATFCDSHAMGIYGTAMELTGPASSNNGGYIDFHYNGSTADYTSRIIEYASGIINVVSASKGDYALRSNSNLVWNEATALNRVEFATSSATVANNSIVTLRTYTVPEAGTYLVTCDFRFNVSNSTTPILYVQYANESGTITLDRYVRGNMANGGGQSLALLVVNAAQSGKIYLKCWQGSGSSVTCSYRYNSFRLRINS